MRISREQLQTFQEALRLVAHGLPNHMREGVIDTITVQIQSTVGQNVDVAAQSIVRRNQGTFDSYTDELAAASVSGEQLVMMLLTIGLNSGNWVQTLALFRDA